jgi:hypothetical protein
MGGAVSISVMLRNNTAEPMTVTKPMYLRVQIIAAGIRPPSPVIWEGGLPPLMGIIEGNQGIARITFDWDQRDSNRRQVPPGPYYASIKLPFLTDFFQGNQMKRQTLQPISTPFQPFIVH